MEGKRKKAYPCTHTKGNKKSRSKCPRLNLLQPLVLELRSSRRMNIRLRSSFSFFFHEIYFILLSVSTAFLIYVIGCMNNISLSKIWQWCPWSGCEHDGCEGIDSSSIILSRWSVVLFILAKIEKKRHNEICDKLRKDKKIWEGAWLKEIHDFTREISLFSSSHKFLSNQ